MWKFSWPILLFSFLIILAVMAFPVDKSLHYQGLKDDCFNHASWMYDRLYNNEADVDIAFIGSSHMIDGINDSLIQSELHGKKVLNFAYCRLGRNLDYIWVREVLEMKNPSTIVLEVRLTENAFSHPIFPHMAQNYDLYSSYPFFNNRYLPDLLMAFQYRIQLIQESLWTDSVKHPVDQNLFGYTAKADTLQDSILNEFYDQRHSRIPKSQWKQDVEDVFPFHYVRKISALCKEHDARLMFLFIPAYGLPVHQPQHLEFLEEFGEVMLPPDSIWTNKNYWFDDNHLNDAGAEVLSRCVVGEL